MENFCIDLDCNFQEAEAEVRDMQIRLRSLTDQNFQLEKGMAELKVSHDKISEDRERLLAENSKLHTIIEEREKTKGFLEEQMKIMNVTEISSE